MDASGFDVDETALGSTGNKLHLPGDLGEQRIIFPHAHVEAGMESTAALPDEDRSATDGLAVETLDSQSLGVAVAAVSGTANSFFMCHFLNLLWSKLIGEI